MPKFSPAKRPPPPPPPRGKLQQRSALGPSCRTGVRRLQRPGAAGAVRHGLPGGVRLAGHALREVVDPRRRPLVRRPAEEGQPRVVGADRRGHRESGGRLPPVRLPRGVRADVAKRRQWHRVGRRFPAGRRTGPPLETWGLTKTGDAVRVWVGRPELEYFFWQWCPSPPPAPGRPPPPRPLRQNGWSSGWTAEGQASSRWIGSRCKPWVSESRHGRTHELPGARDRASLHSHALGLQTP